jgi:hypothetical protein
MVYVDLNPLRAGIATALQECRFTSLIQRLKVIKAGRARRRKGGRSKGRRAGRGRRWVIPIESIFSMRTRDYVSLVAHSGGVATDEIDHADRLSRLGIDPDRWSEVMGTTARMIGTAVGRTAELVREAERRGCRRIVNALDVYRN